MTTASRCRRPAARQRFPLARVLRERGQSKRQLARLSGLPYPMICRLVKRGSNPTWATLQRIAVALGADLGDFGPRRKQA